MYENRLTIDPAEFKAALKPFARKGVKLGQVMVAFEGGFLSIESGDVVCVMHASGAWHGRATFKPSVLQALAKVPPVVKPIPLAYADSHLLLAGMTIPCEWQSTAKALVNDLLNPSLPELLAMARTIPRAEIRGTDLGKRIASSISAAERRIKAAAKQLQALGVTEAEIRLLVESKVTGLLVKQ
jgi:hypothetical protein